MATEQAPQRRITSKTKRHMLFVAALFDVLPFVLTILLFVFVFSLSGDNIVTQIVAKVAGGLLAVMLWYILPMVSFIITFFVNVLAGVTFFVWFRAHGVKMLDFGSTRRVLTSLATVVVEFLPIVNLVPATIWSVWNHIRITNLEDKLRGVTPEAQPEPDRNLYAGYEKAYVR